MIKRLVVCLTIGVLFTLQGCVLMKGGQPTPKVMTGLDVLEKEQFARLKGKRVGIIANHSAINAKSVHMLDLMLKSGNINLTAIFSPEHGFKGVAGGKIENATEEKTGLPIYSLYGETRRPKEEWLKQVDVLVFDIQDIGARFYTYISTMAISMEEAKKNDVKFMVLDRPNPISGLKVDGPVQDKDLLGRFTSFFPMPVMHGMTIGELATMFNEEYGIQCDLEIVKMEGWKRTMYFDDTGLPWVNPSPNIRNVKQEILYPGIALTEFANVSVGRGTDTPFEWMGAQWIKAEDLAAELKTREIPGIKFEPVAFTPKGRRFKGEVCGGVKFTITDRGSFMAVVNGIHIMDAIYRLYPDVYKIDKTRTLVGKKSIIEMIKRGAPVEVIVASWQEELGQFVSIREKYILYKE